MILQAHTQKKLTDAGVKATITDQDADALALLGHAYHELSMRRRWCTDNHVWLSAAYIPGKENTVADEESRKINLDTDQLNKALTQLNMKPNIDLFASRLNNQMQCCASCRPDPSAYVIDGFFSPCYKAIFTFMLKPSLPPPSPPPPPPPPPPHPLFFQALSRQCAQHIHCPVETLRCEKLGFPMTCRMSCRQPTS